MIINLSPYEKNRIIPDEFGWTEMGKVLLEQDYELKQLTASLMNPESELGEEFWAKVYAEAYAKYGTADIPVDTFNKVWIIPDKAVVYENGDRAFVVESHLKVMLEEDYEAMEHNVDRRGLIHQTQDKGMINHAPTDIIRETIIPAIEQEVNQGQTFAPLRQVYHSFILASWYKNNLKASALNKAYSDQKKIGGLESDVPTIKQDIYQRYLNAFKTGAYDLIKEEYNPATQEIVARKYFSGGTKLTSDVHKYLKDDSLLTKMVGVDNFRRVNVDFAQINKRKQNNKFNALREELLKWGNKPKDVNKFIRLWKSRFLPKSRIEKTILELAGGGTEVAHEIAKNNRQQVVLVIDAFHLERGNKYNRYFHMWKNNKLKAKSDPLPNLAVMRIPIEEILRLIPEKSIDDILFINPEPALVVEFFEFLEKEQKIKEKLGNVNVFLKPYGGFYKFYNTIVDGQPEFLHVGKELYGVELDSFSIWGDEHTGEKRDVWGLKIGGAIKTVEDKNLFNKAMMTQMIDLDKKVISAGASWGSGVFQRV